MHEGIGSQQHSKVLRNLGCEAPAFLRREGVRPPAHGRPDFVDRAELLFEESAVTASRRVIGSSCGHKALQAFDQGGDLSSRALPYLTCDAKDFWFGGLDVDAATARTTKPAIRLLAEVRLLSDLVHAAVKVRDEVDCERRTRVRTKVVDCALTLSMESR